jgi:hypothetical protein
MGAPMGNKNAAGSRGGVSSGAKKYLSKKRYSTKPSPLRKKGGFDRVKRISKKSSVMKSVNNRYRYYL